MLPQLTSKSFEVPRGHGTRVETRYFFFRRGGHLCRGSVSNRAVQSDGVVVVHILRNAFLGFLLGGTTLRVVFPFTKKG